MPHCNAINVFNFIDIRLFYPTNEALSPSIAAKVRIYPAISNPEPPARDNGQREALTMPVINPSRCPLSARKNAHRHSA